MSKLKIDNTTAVAAINNMGTNHSVQCNKVALDIWHWCMARNIWISAEHTAGKCNEAADRQLGKINTNTEWMLNPTLLNKALDKLQAHPDVDMFPQDSINNSQHIFPSDLTLEDT